MRIFYYTDEGPSGPCAQSCEVMRHRRDVIIFHDDDEAEEFLEKIKTAGVKNPKVQEVLRVSLIRDKTCTTFDPFDDDLGLVRRIKPKDRAPHG